MHFPELSLACAFENAVRYLSKWYTRIDRSQLKSSKITRKILNIPHLVFLATYPPECELFARQVLRTSIIGTLKSGSSKLKAEQFFLLAFRREMHMGCMRDLEGEWIPGRPFSMVL